MSSSEFLNGVLDVVYVQGAGPVTWNWVEGGDVTWLRSLSIYCFYQNVLLSFKLKIKIDLAAVD